MTYILSDPVPAAYPFLFSAAAQPGEVAGGAERARGLALWLAIGVLRVEMKLQSRGGLG